MFPLLCKKASLPLLRWVSILWMGRAMGSGEGRHEYFHPPFVSHRLVSVSCIFRFLCISTLANQES